MTKKYYKKRKTRNIKKRKTSYKRKLKYTQKKRGGVLNFMKRLTRRSRASQPKFNNQVTKNLSPEEELTLNLMKYYRNMISDLDFSPTLEGFLSLYMPDNVTILRKFALNEDEHESFKEFKEAIEKKNETANKIQKIDPENKLLPVEKGFLAHTEDQPTIKLSFDERIIPPPRKEIIATGWIPPESRDEPKTETEIYDNYYTPNNWKKLWLQSDPNYRGGKKKKTRRRGGFRPGLKLCLTKKNVVSTKGPE